MHIIKITDGLGHQMFQYAFARRLGLETGKQVYLDTRFINNEDKRARGETNEFLRRADRRSYGLDHFRTVLPIADAHILSKWDFMSRRDREERLVYSLAVHGFWPCQYRKDTGRLFGWKDFLLPAYFEGYYFDRRYYEKIRPILQREFCLKTPARLPERLKEILKNEETVSIHVRRGDFLKFGRDISGTRYYPQAVALMNRKIRNPVYLIFSDDIAWVKENMEIDGRKLYVSGTGLADYEEFAVMKHCKHHIMANSTFSYWAAYLNANPEKVVVYTKGKWTKMDIIPEGWLSIGNP